MAGLRADVYRFHITDELIAANSGNDIVWQGSEIDYYYPSRLPGEPLGGITDIHFHPTVPRTGRVNLVVGF